MFKAIEYTGKTADITASFLKTAVSHLPYLWFITDKKDMIFRETRHFYSVGTHFHTKQASDKDRTFAGFAF
ncbi:MAG: hypothetical protein ACYSU5_01395 [Planctomycetota bacterium]